HIRKNGKHTPLKCGRSIAESKWHPPISEDTEWACERSLLLICRINHNLVVASITIQKTIVCMSSQPF
ncbi:hypothetical protein PIB30_060909, partial [Stylosanthes scabra]|nr:hypothetical protein [Stylosanthes scabra]